MHVSLYMSCVCCRRYYTVIDGMIRSAVEYKYSVSMTSHKYSSMPSKKWLFYMSFLYTYCMLASDSSPVLTAESGMTLFLQNNSSTENSGQWIVRCSSTTSLVSMMSSIYSFICKQFANTSFLNCAQKRETNDVSGLLVEYK